MSLKSFGKETRLCLRIKWNNERGNKSAINVFSYNYLYLVIHVFICLCFWYVYTYFIIIMFYKLYW